ncbi:MAG: DUF503 domain-containing protein [Pseudomonadota bacterium]
MRLQASFFLHGCRSLKDKRRRLAKLRDKFGTKPHVSVCESDFQDDLQRAQWSFIVCAAGGVVVEQACSDIETYLRLSVDAELLSIQRDWLVPG